MKQGERRAIALSDDAAVLYECSNTPSTPVPRLTIHNAPYSEGDTNFPACAATVFGEAVRDLYNMLHAYYSEADELLRGE